MGRHALLGTTRLNHTRATVAHWPVVALWYAALCALLRHLAVLMLLVALLQGAHHELPPLPSSPSLERPGVSGEVFDYVVSRGT